MKSNPPVPSRLGCGGLLLLVLATPSVALAVPGAGLNIGDESYTLGAGGWLIAPLVVVSLIAVIRLASGHRDWLPPVVSAVWMGVAAGLAIGTGQFRFLIITVVITLLLTSGIWADRRLADSEGESIEADAKPRSPASGS